MMFQLLGKAPGVEICVLYCCGGPMFAFVIVREVPYCFDSNVDQLLPAVFISHPLIHQPS